MCRAAITGDGKFSKQRPHVDQCTGMSVEKKAALTSFLMALESLVFGGGLCAGPGDFPADIQCTKEALQRQEASRCRFHETC